MSKYPDRRGHVYTDQIAVRVEPELKAAFEEVKRLTKKDVPEAQRIVLRELAERLRNEADGPDAA